MATQHRPAETGVPQQRRVVFERDIVLTRAARYALSITRLFIGWIFLWAFMDKLWGLDYATPEDASWLNGGSPTEGFLMNSATGPFEDFYKDTVAGAAWADWLFMLGLLGIGAALILGIGMRLAAISGVILLVMMWSVVLPPDNNPFMDDHLVMAAAVVVLALTYAGDTLGLGQWWGRLGIVRRFPILR